MKDAAVAYDCPVSGRTWILIGRNVLHIEGMQDNLMPPFVMREGGVIVNEKPKIHCEDPTVDDHCISFHSCDLRIPLSLTGIFSCFQTRMPTVGELESCDKVFITPDSSDWNPNCDSFADNEKSRINFHGEISEPNRWLNDDMLLDDDEDNEFDMSAFTVESLENAIDVNVSLAICDDVLSRFGCNHDEDFARDMSRRAAISSARAVHNLDPNDSPNISNNIFDEGYEGTLEGLVSMIDGLVPTEKLHEVEAQCAAMAKDMKGPSPELLSKLWMIPENLAKDAIDQNTHLCRRPEENSMSRNFSTNDRMLRYRRLNSVFFTDALVATSCKSTRGNKYAQVFVSDKGFVAVYPMKSQNEFEEALHWFCKQVGVPRELICDGHKSMSKNLKVKRFSHQVGLTIRALERATPWANRAELYIGILKEAARKDLSISDCPMVLWDYALERRALIHNLVPRPLFQNNRPPHEATFGESGDISRLADFGFLQWCYYRDHGSFPANKSKLGRVIGPCKNEGNEMAQNILTAKGTVVPRRTLRPLTQGEKNSEIEKRKRDIFVKLIRDKLGDSLRPPPKDDAKKGEEFDAYLDDDEPVSATLPDDNDPLLEGKAQFEQPITDRWINAELSLPQGEEMQRAKVISRAKDGDGVIQGRYSENPFQNTLTYNVEFDDGAVREYKANVIAENLYAQVDKVGHSMFDRIVDFRIDKDELPAGNTYVMTKSGNRRMRQSTDGWDFLVQWRDGSTQWIALKDLKQSNPVECAEYAVSCGIDKEPAFSWWVPYTLKKRDRIIGSVNTRAQRESHKYGIELPRNVQHAKIIDKRNKNTFWQDAIAKEMANLKIAFDILGDDEHMPVGYTRSSGHMVFDVRMTLERKARWVKDGHKTPDPEWSTYAGVVSRESIRIAMVYAALNDLDICGADVMNAYLQAPTSEKHFVICGPEFGLENEGKRAIIRRALYGGKSAGADYWRHVRAAMDHMGFKPCRADPDVWMRPGIKANGDEYWQFVLLYVDDMVAIMEDPESFLRDEFDQNYFVLKENSIGRPTQYLGNKVVNVDMEDGTNAWGFSSSQYVQEACDNVYKRLESKGEKPLLKHKSPWPNNYRPEADVTPELNSEDASYYSSLIGVLRWIVELGRADICMEVSAMSSMMALPREGHLAVLYHMFGFLKSKHNGLMVFSPAVPTIDESLFQKEDWSASEYGDCKETMPHDPPATKGKGFVMRAFVDSDHAGDSLTRRSRTGFMVFLNSAPIHWFSKKQTSVETSSFGSEFIAMKSCCEYVRGLRFKLRMMGIPVDDFTYVFGDNQSVLVNSTKPHSSLKKKSSSVAYHFVREGVAKDEWRATYLNTNLNPADMLTKSLCGGEKRTLFTSYFLYYVD